MSADTADIEPADVAAMEAHLTALYELRLSQLPRDDNTAWPGYRWATAVVCEAMCVLELQFGAEEAREMVQKMLESRANYDGPRVKRMRH